MKSIVDKAINILDGQLAEKNISISLSNSARLSYRRGVR